MSSIEPRTDIGAVLSAENPTIGVNLFRRSSGETSNNAPGEAKRSRPSGEASLESYRRDRE
jgi:hypothetical protein